MSNPSGQSLKHFLVVHTENHDEWVIRSMSKRKIMDECNSGELSLEDIVIIDGVIVKHLGTKSPPFRFRDI